jgi:DNA repair protein RadC
MNTPSLAIRQWPAHERPRERLLAAGPAALADAELLAVLIGCGRRGVNAVELARHLLAEAGGDLRRLLQSAPSEAVRRSGIGPVRWAQLLAAAELGRRLHSTPLRRGAAITAPGDVREALRAHLRDRMREVFAVIFLDARHQLIRLEDLFQGGLTGATVHVGEVVRRALALGAAAVIVAHNHPSGIAEPSQMDRELTERLRQALALVEVRLLDHVIVGDLDTVSFVERGWL